MSVNINDILKLMHYEVVEGSPHLWDCYGQTARIMDFGRGEIQEPQSWNVSVIFNSDPKNGHVYEITIEQDYKFYRWQNPKYKNKFIAECQMRGHNPDIAYDDVHYITIASYTTLKKCLRSLYKNNMITM